MGRESGQTAITTDDGIEVFNKEKYYLLKKNVKIISDEFELNADLVRAYFSKDLYDITKIFADGNVTLNSSKGVKASGEKIDFDTTNENLQIFGRNSLFISNEIYMNSDEEIKINNITGEFTINGPNQLYNATINTFNDHRIAMMCIIAKLSIMGKVERTNQLHSLISTSFPEFYKLIKKVYV